MGMKKRKGVSDILPLNIIYLIIFIITITITLFFITRTLRNVLSVTNYSFSILNIVWSLGAKGFNWVINSAASIPHYIHI